MPGPPRQLHQDVPPTTQPDAAARMEPEADAAGASAAGLSNEHDKSIPLYCQHSPSNNHLRGTLRRVLFPRTHSEMEVYQGRPPLNKQKTIMVDWLDYLVILLVMVTCVLLCLQDPLDPESTLTYVIGVASNVVGFLFSLENVLRILCFGFIYFKADYWNIFDSLIVASSLVTTIIDLVGSNRQSGIEALRIFILFRVLRSVRFIDTARITMIASIRAFKSIGDVGVLLVLFLVLVATSGVTQYNSRLTNRCIGEEMHAVLEQNKIWAAWNDTTTSGGAVGMDLTPYEKLLMKFSNVGNFTRFQDFDMLRLQRLRRLVEYRQCGYRYADYRAVQNITVCSYHRECKTLTNISREMHRRVTYINTSASSSSGSSNCSSSAANCTETTDGSAFIYTTDLEEVYRDYQSCIFVDGSVVCSSPNCRADAPFVTRTYVEVVTYNTSSALTTSNIVGVARPYPWPSYFNDSEHQRVCSNATLVAATDHLEVTYCIDVDSQVENLDQLLRSKDEAPLSSGGVGGTAAVVDAAEHSGSYYCQIETMPTTGNIRAVRSGGKLADVALPFPSRWTITETELDNSTTGVGVVPFPGMNNWCKDELAHRTDLRFALTSPYRLPNVTGMNVTTSCSAVNASMASSSTEPFSNLCCGRNEEGRAVCCLSSNRSASTNEFPPDSMHAVCCSVASAASEATTYLIARPHGAYNSSTSLPTKVMSLSDLVASEMFNHSVCESALPQQLFAGLYYSINRSTANPDTTFYSKQHQTWQLRVNFNLTNILTVASCADKLFPDPSLLSPAQRLAVENSNKHRLFQVSYREGGSYSGIVPPSLEAFVKPPRQFRPTTQGFNTSVLDYDDTDSALYGINQTALPCVVKSECFSRPLLLNEDGFDDEYDLVTYSCGTDFDNESDPFSGDAIPFGAFGLHWTDNIFSLLPPYDEAFRGLERQAMGPTNVEAVSWKERNCDNSKPIYLDGYKCPFGYECTPYQNPFFGMLGFENLPNSMLTDFTCISREAWYDIMYRAMDAVDQTAAIYFLLVTIVGALFITNLMIVLLTVEFDSCVEEERKRLNERKAQQKVLRRQHRERLKAQAETARWLGEGGDGNIGGGGEFDVNSLTAVKKELVDDDDPFAIDGDDDDDDDDDDAKGNVLDKLGNFLQRQLDSDRRRGASIGGQSSTTKRGGSTETGSLRGSLAASLNRRSSIDRGSKGNAGGDPLADLEMQSFDDNASLGGDPLDGPALNAEEPDDDEDPLSTSVNAPVNKSFLSASTKRIPAAAKKVSRLQAIRRDMREALYSHKGLLVTNVLILGNMVVLGAVYYGMSNTMRDILDLLNFAFTVIFTCELAYRLFCIDIWNFVRSTMSMLDFAVVVVSWIDIAVPSITIPIIRGVRVIRLLNVFKPFPNVYKWIKVIVRSLKSSVVLFIMCSFFTFVFAVFGMSLFGGRFCDFADQNVLRPDDTIAWCGNRPRSNYDTLVQALLTSFQIMTGDDWHLVMVNGMRARGGFFALFFVANYVIGNMVLLNLLIGILLSVRTATDEDDRRKTALSMKRMAQARAEADWGTVMMLEERAEWKRKRFALIQFKTDEEKRVEEAAAMQRLLTEYSKIELRVQRFVESSAFRYTVLIMTIVNTIGLALQSPFRAPDTPAELVLWVIDLATNVFFVLELLVECLAYGVILNQKSYLKRDRWNVFDLSMVCVFLVTQATSLFTKSQGQAQLVLRGLSALRALRPIRFVAESKGMRLVLKSLMDSVGPLGNLMVVILIVMTLFGIMGVQIFQGLFYYCNGTDPLISYISLGKTECEAVGGRWTNAPYNFDHLGEAYVTLFVLSTMEGWSTIMFNGMDATDTFNEPPIVNIQRKNAVYFIAFLVIGSIFFVNLFVSIIIDSFQQAQRLDPSGGRTAFLTKQQNAWIRSQHTMLSHIAVVDYDGVITVEDATRNQLTAIRRVVRYICRHPLFDVFVYCCIFVNFIVMAVEEYPQSDSMEVFGRVTNIFFTTIFTVEVILRLVSESPRRYVASKWNRFDLIVVFLSLLALLFELVFANATFVAFFRSMRAIRLLRLLRKSRRLQAVLRKFLVAMYSLSNIGGILFLVLFCYGLIGMKLFGRVVYDGVIDRNANFQNIFSAFLMMLRVATGGNWGDVLHSCTQSEFQGYCLDRLGDCGINVVGQIFFLTFVVLATFVLLNVFVAVILDVFTSMTGEVDILSAWDASQFMKLWFHFDPERTYRMESRFLLTLLRHIPPTCVLGMGNVPSRRRLQYELVFVESLSLEENDGKVELQDVIHALCDRAFRKVKDMDDPTNPGRLDPLPIERARLLKQKMDRHFRRKKRDRYKPVRCETYPVVHRVAAQIITAYWQRYRSILLPHTLQVRKSYQARRDLQNEIVEMSRSLVRREKLMAAAGGGGASSDAASVGSAVDDQRSKRPVQTSPLKGASSSSSAGGAASVHQQPRAAGGVSGGSGGGAPGVTTATPHPTSSHQPLPPMGLSPFSGLVGLAHTQPNNESSAYRSLVPPSSGVLSSFRVLDPRSKQLDRHGHQRSIVDVLMSEDHQHAHTAATRRRSIGDTIRSAAQQHDVRVWNESETMAIAQSIAAHKQFEQMVRDSIAHGYIPEEEQSRRRVVAEEEEARSMLGWRRIHDMQNVAAGGW